MIEETGTVIALLPEGRVLVHVPRRKACGGCDSGDACSVPAMPGERPGQQAVSARTGGHDIRIGDTVVLGVEESLLWRGMGLLYVLPVLGMALAGMGGQWLAGEAGAATGAIAGLVGALLGAGLISRKHRQDKYLPIVIKKGLP